MSALARPALVALFLFLAAVVLHPGLQSETWLAERSLVLAALVVLAALALVARAAKAAPEGRIGDLLVAAGALTLVAALGTDGIRGHHGSLALVAGQASSNFDEIGPEGRRLGLRPLGLTVEAERIEPDGRTRLAVGGRAAPVDLEAGRAVALGGFRLAHPRAMTTGGVARLRVGVADGSRTEVAEVAPARPGLASGISIALEEYFPDFALDEGQRPFSRSTEHRNPAALLTVERRGQAFRAFVIRSMPGIHRVEGLGLSFSLLDVEPARSVEINVHREPGALLALVGGLLLAVGLGVSAAARARSGLAPPSPDPAARALVAGPALVGFLLVADRGAVLAWAFGVPTAEGRVPLPGVGVLLGAALVASLGGSVLLAARELAGPGTDVRQAARGLLGAGVVFGSMGGVVAVIQLLRLAGGGLPAAARPVVGLLLAVGLVALSLRPLRRGEPAVSGTRLSELALPLAVLLAVLAALAAGVLGVLRDGTYGTMAVSALAATALLGAASLEPTRLAAGRRVAFLVALLTLTLR
jgi:hypothetical protein